MKPSKEQNSIVNLESKNASLGQHGMNKNACATSFKSIINQEVQFEDNDYEESLQNLSLEDLNNKIEVYKNLFLENKINTFNAFEIDLISCVLQVVKKTKVTNFLEISNLFDAMSKVYTCRVDDFLTTGNKLVKEFSLEINYKKHKQNEIKMKPSRKKVMLTTADKLHRKDHLVSSSTKYSSINLDNDIIDYAKPSRILINKFSCLTYWPEYNFSKKIGMNCDKNQEVNYYEMKNIGFNDSNQIEKGEICPNYHQFMAECDNSTNYDDLSKLDNIMTHFDPETSTLSNHSSEGSYEFMDEQNPERIVKESSSLNNRNESINNQENLVSVSQMLPIVNSKSSDYTFFDPKRLCYFKSPNHWKDKFKQMIMTSKQKAMCNKYSEINDFQTSMTTNISKEECNKLKNIQYKVDFNVNMTAIMSKLKNNTAKHQCDYNLWKPFNNITPYPNKPKMNLLRRLEFCKYINMIPDWCKSEINGLMEFNCMTPQSSMIVLPDQDIFNANLPCNEDLENADNCSTKYICKSDDENCSNEVEVNNDNNCCVRNEIDKAFEFHKCTPGYVDMKILKNKMRNIIKPDGDKALSITFKDLLLRLPKLLPENMKENISVAVIYVALLHLCNEHNLHLKNYNDEIIISQD